MLKEETIIYKGFSNNIVHLVIASDVIFTLF